MMKSLSLLGLLVATTAGATQTDKQQQNSWYQQGQETLAKLKAQKIFPEQAKNVIFFVGDGMSLSTITAARIYQGQLQSKDGEEHHLSFEQFPYTALSKTYNTNLQTPDSAGTMTAMITGVKTKAGAISVDETVQIGVCDPKVPRLTSLLTQAEIAGMKTGIVTTTRLTHATPAAAYAHAEKRGWEADSDMPRKQRKNCTDIAKQLIEYPHGDGIEVTMGGGRKNFISKKATDPEYPKEKGERKDGLNLTEIWQKKHPQGQYVWNKTQFDAIDIQSADKLLGLFEPSHMQYEIERNSDGSGEPSLAEMTQLSIDFLSKNDAPYFLLVEGGRIDHGHHAGYAKKALHDTAALSDAVKAALEKVDLNETLILVTADHSHTMSMSGYAQKGNPILGKIKIPDDHGNHSETLQKDSQGKPMTTLSYANGPGYVNGDKRPDLTHVDTEHKDYKQAATIPLYSETHSGEDVIIYATGAGSQWVRGVLEQNMIYHIMKSAIEHQLSPNNKGN